MNKQLPIPFEGEKQPIVYYNLSNLNPSRATDIVTNDIGLYRVKQDIQRWRNAIIYAENKLTPNRTEYYRLCKDVVLDPHLTAVMNQRKKAVLARELVLVDAEGNEDKEKTKIFRKKWFRKLLNFALDTKFYGFSLIDLGPLINDEFPDIKLVPRQYVRPELNIVVPNIGSFHGTPIDDPKFVNWNIFLGDREDLGLLVKAAPFVIWKKGGMGYWSESNEKFGMPIRIGKTKVKDDDLKANMENALRTMGSAFYAMINEDDSFEMLSSGIANAWENFDQMRLAVNEEISKLVLCQTGTSDQKSYVGAAAVHQDVMGDVTEDDVLELEADLNETVKKVLVYHGFDIENLFFQFRYNESIPLAEKAKIDAEFMKELKQYGLKPTKEYLETTYNIELEEIQEPDGDEPGEKKSQSLLTNYGSISEIYSHQCPECLGYENKEKDDLKDNPFNEEDKKRLLEGIVDRIITIYKLPEWIYEKTAQLFEIQILKGFKASTFGTGDSLLNELRHNIYVFSAAKTYQQVRDIQSLLVKYPKRKDLFVKKASEAFDNYNKNWLSTEVDTAYNSALQARNWKNIYSSKNLLPFLEYQTVGDSRVRPTHAALDGIIRKVGDTFWDVYYPPNGWRCRCSTIQHQDVEQVTSLKDFKAPDDVPEIFKMNSGKDGIIFSEKHPYFKVAKGDRDWALRNFGLPLP